MKRFFIMFLCVLLLGTGVVAAYTAKTASEDSTNLSGLNGTLSESKQEALQVLRKKGAAMVGSYVYQEKVIEGQADPSMERMNLQVIENIIANSDSFEDILTALKNKQMYPDYIGGSGVTLIEYWFDSQGNEKIIIIYEQSHIFYSHVEGDMISTKLLYG